MESVIKEIFFWSSATLMTYQLQMHKIGIQMFERTDFKRKIIKKYDTPSESVRNYYDRSDETKRKRIYKTEKLSKSFYAHQKMAWKPNERTSERTGEGPKSNIKTI